MSARGAGDEATAALATEPEGGGGPLVELAACARASATTSCSTASTWRRARRGDRRRRPVRLGQVDDAALHQRPRDDRRAATSSSTGVRSPGPARTINRLRARDRHGLPAVQPLPAHDRAATTSRSAPIEVQGRRSRGGAGSGRSELLERVGHPREGRRLPGRPLGRPAAARRDRARARHGAQADALRRADLGARPGDDPRGARRHARPRAGRHDDDRRHARDGLRARGVRPHRVHRRGRDRRGGPARGVLRATRRASGHGSSWTRSSTTDEEERRCRTDGRRR